MASISFAVSQAEPLFLKPLHVLARIPSHSKICSPSQIRKFWTFFLIARG